DDLERFQARRVPLTNLARVDVDAHGCFAPPHPEPRWRHDLRRLGRLRSITQADDAHDLRLLDWLRLRSDAFRIAAQHPRMIDSTCRGSFATAIRSLWLDWLRLWGGRLRIHGAPQTFAKMARDVGSLNLGARALRPLCGSRPFGATSRRTPDVATGVGCDRTTGRSDVFGRIRVRCRATRSGVSRYGLRPSVVARLGPLILLVRAIGAEPLLADARLLDLTVVVSASTARFAERSFGVTSRRSPVGLIETSLRCARLFGLTCVVRFGKRII